MRLVQILDSGGTRRVAVAPEGGDGDLRLLDRVESTYELARGAIARDETLEKTASAAVGTATESYDRALAELRVLPPLDHPEPSRCLVSGTGLSHLGSAEARDAMHKSIKAAGATLTDSMKMFQRGVDGGKPGAGRVGAQPEWFWKGDGSILARPGAPLVSPGWAEDAGEEAEVVGLYVVGDDGTPRRLGFALGNEFSDHVMEQWSYLDLAHSKLRPCAVGPELRLGPLPDAVEGEVRILRGGTPAWSGPFLSGESNMSHAVANLEHHHFRYPLFRRPGDVHLHFLGAAGLSFAAGFRGEPGDVFEIEVAGFGRPLANPLEVASDPGFVEVRPL